MRSLFAGIVAVIFLASPALGETQAVKDANAALDALDKGDYATAEHLLTKVLKEGGLSSSDRELAYVTRAKAYLGEKRNDLALADINEALKIDSTDKEAIDLRAQIQAIPTQSGEKITYCSDPDNGDQIQANVFLQNAQIDKAINLYSKIIARCPNSAPSYYGRGVAYGTRAFYSKSEADSERGLADTTEAIRLDPTISLYFIARASIYDNMQDCTHAIPDYNQAITLNPADTNAITLRGNAEDKCGDFRSAIADYNKVLATDPANPHALWLRAVSYMNQGLCIDAIRDYTKVLENPPNTYQHPAEALNSRGVCYWKMGRNTEAVADFEEALRIDPSNADARQNLSATR